MPLSRHEQLQRAMFAEMDHEGRARARTAAIKRMAEVGVNRTRLAAEAGVSRNTVKGFLDGDTWPIDATLKQIDVVLGWEPGTLSAIARTVPAATGRSPEYLSESLTSRPLLEQWVPLLTDEERAAMEPAELDEVISTGRSAALQRWREIQTLKAQRAVRRYGTERGRSDPGNSP